LVVPSPLEVVSAFSFTLGGTRTGIGTVEEDVGEERGRRGEELLDKVEEVETAVAEVGLLRDLCVTT
jgi:hypothetical protein